jgi:glyceraldehyde 3-phosphate dehydrogenase
MNLQMNTQRVLGINGMGRIGKLLVWHYLHRRSFDRIVLNLGRGAGSGLADLLDALAHDSTYGPVERFLQGAAGVRSLKILDEPSGLVEVMGLPVKVLRQARNPRQIDWRAEGVQVVVDCTGAFTDPTVDSSKPSLRGHLDGGARVVVVSAPFKVKDKSRPLPDEATMLIQGINHRSFDPHRHQLVSAASCTTTGLAHLLMPILDTDETSRVLTASMSTIHAATNTQSVLDSVPTDGATDLRKNRAVFDNIILSSTGAAGALAAVLPQIHRIGFMADSVRVPTSTVSLIILNLTVHSPVDDKNEPVVNREFINGLYRRAAEGPQQGLLVYTDRQNVSCDLKGQRAAVIVEGHENHTRTGVIDVPPAVLAAQGLEVPGGLRIPVTHAKIFGWYDNEYGSYTNCLGELTEHVHRAVG